MINFAIPTVVHYLDKTLPVVVDSLLQNGVSKDNIHVFVNDSHSNIYEVVDRIHFHHNVGLSYFEWISPKLIIERNLQSDRWFLLHDTVRFGPNMASKLYTSIHNNPDVDIFKLTPVHSNSIGMIHQRVFEKHKSFFYKKLQELDTFTDMVQRKVWCIQNENQYLHLEPFHYFQQEDAEHLPPQIEYGVQRLVEYFHGIDMYKFKKNGYGYAAVKDVNL